MRVSSDELSVLCRNLISCVYPGTEMTILRSLNRTTMARGAALSAAIGLVAACSGGASYAVRMSYLETMAHEGVQTHRLLASQGAITTIKRCTGAYNGLQDQNPPDDTGTGQPSQAWLDQIEAFFVQSCVTGLPKPAPGQPVAPHSASPTESSTTPSAPSGKPTATATP
jgi:hypothetical protein